LSDAYDRWLLELGSKAKATKRQYLDHFTRFCKRWSITPESFYIKLKDARDPAERREVENMVKLHMKEMQDGGLSASTCRMVYKAVTSFYEAQGLEFSLKAKDQPKGQSNGQRRAKVDQIRRLYNYLSPEFGERNRALITFFKDTGLRSGDVAALTVGDYRRPRFIIRNNEKFKAFDPFETEKTKGIAFIHCGPEAIEDLEVYLKDRARKNSGDLPDDWPLFAIRGGERFSNAAISNLIFRMARHLGDEGRKISAHSLRKFHTTMLEGEMNSSWIAKLQGKSIGGSWGSYSHPEGDARERENFDPDMLTEAYIKAYNVLRIRSSKTQEDQERDRELEQTKMEIEKLRAEITARDEATRALERSQTQIREEVSANKSDVDLRLEQLKKEIFKELAELDKLDSREPKIKVDSKLIRETISEMDKATDEELTQHYEYQKRILSEEAERAKAGKPGLAAHLKKIKRMTETQANKEG